MFKPRRIFLNLGRDIDPEGINHDLSTLIPRLGHRLPTNKDRMSLPSRDQLFDGRS